VDKVKIRNPKTGNLMSRIADVGNPWLDAGIVPYSTMGYNTNRAEWQKWFPADFITESFPGQFRNWFYAILAMSTMMEHRPPFEVLLGHALVRDQHGETMAKTKGNAIEFNGAANDGYELFHERDPKVGVEQQAKRDLPKGWTSCYEGEVVLEGKRVQVVKGKYPPIGADVIRWLYCRSNPAVNINFGPESADDVRARFVLKLWNTYAFFCNLARIDAFDPTVEAVPLARRPDMDRWILSDLQQLMELARTSFNDYNVMAFCLEAERFVDARLSNWYVRRSKGRFNKSGQDEDKLAAYQTLYEVLVTLTRLLAPAMPFLCETMYQNLVVQGQSNKPGVPPSVHLCEYPSPDTTMLDEQLSADMDDLMRLVSLGLAARQEAKIKVRQPLTEIRVQPASESDRRAVERFRDQLLAELNIKKVSLHDPAAGPLLRAVAGPNMKTLGPKFGARLQEVRSAILAKPMELAARVQKGEPFELACPNGSVTLDPTDLVVEHQAPEGWAGVRDRAPRSDQDTQVAINATITEELAGEGMAREVVRYVNDLRKKAELELEDRITLRLCTTSDRLHQAIQAHRDYIAGETLTTGWAESPLDGQAHRNTVKVEGQELLIELRRVDRAGSAGPR
jgi:isoleucyl-tRNA synthetase